MARLGALRFAGSGGILLPFMMLHVLVVHPPGALFGYPAAVYGYGFILALFGTVAPAILMTLGLKRAGPQRFAVMGAIGPVATLFLAWSILGKQPNVFQALGSLRPRGWARYCAPETAPMTRQTFPC